MTTYSRPVLLLLCGLLLLTLAIAVLNTLVPLWLAHEHLPTWQVGMVGSSYFTGNLLGTLLAGRLIARCGFNRSYYLASALFAAGCVGLGITLAFWSWLAWRFIAGVGCAMIWVVVESALMCSGNARNRGRLLAAYMMVYYVGTVLGQLLVSKVPTSLMAVLPWLTALVLTAMLPLLFTRIASPSGEPPGQDSGLADAAPASGASGVNGCILSGIVLGVLYGLMPLYLNHQGERRGHRLLDGGDGERRHPGAMAGGASGGSFRAPAGAAGTGAGGDPGAMAMLGNAAMGPTLFILGPRASRSIRWPWPGPARRWSSINWWP